MPARVDPKRKPNMLRKMIMSVDGVFNSLECSWIGRLAGWGSRMRMECRRRLTKPQGVLTRLEMPQQAFAPPSYAPADHTGGQMIGSIAAK